jgi:hypothetical protein
LDTVVYPNWATPLEREQELLKEGSRAKDPKKIKNPALTPIA